MRRKTDRVLGVAARCGRIGCVVVDAGDLVIWDASRKGASSAAAASRKLRTWIDEFRPDVLVTEHPGRAGKKRGRQLEILRAYRDVGQGENLVNMAIRRQRSFANVYDEAAHFAGQFPDLAPLLPPRPPIWCKEPHSLIFFEALALIRDAGLLTPPVTPAQ